MERMKWKIVAAGITLSSSILVLFGIRECLAIPAWSRKYNTDCSTCHRPNVPRLNVEGHTFRKLGFRFPDEVGKKPDYKEIGDYISLRVRARYSHNDPEEGDTSSRFELNDATLFYAGPVTENLTGFVELEWEDADDIVLNAYLSWLFGTPDFYLNVRGGQMHTLSRVGWAGFDRPSVVSTAGILSERLTTSPVPFTIGQDQKGLELAFGPTRDIRIIAQVLNGLNLEGKGNAGSADDDTDKDFLLAYEHILDKKGSGFTLFGYRGVWHQDINGNGSLDEKEDVSEFKFYRFGATASILFDIFQTGYSEILGGAMWSRDNFPDDHPTGTDKIKGQAYFVELEQYFEKNTCAFVRADFIQRDTREDDWRNKYTIGSAYTVNNNLRLAAEVFVRDLQDERRQVFGGVAEAMLNF